jgi:hypothetical protein
MVTKDEVLEATGKRSTVPYVVTTMSRLKNGFGSQPSGLAGMIVSLSCVNLVLV